MSLEILWASLRTRRQAWAYLTLASREEQRDRFVPSSMRSDAAAGEKDDGIGAAGGLLEEREHVAPGPKTD